MNSFINELEPHERSLLHIGLTQIKENCERQIAISIIHGDLPAAKQFSEVLLNEINSLSKKLFAETFVDETDYLKYYSQQYSALCSDSNFHGTDG